MTIAKYTFNVIFFSLSLLLLSAVAGHFFAVKSTLTKQADIQLQTQAYLSETLLDKTFNSAELLSDNIINSNLRAITQTQASISVELVLADGSKTYTQQSSQPFHQPDWFTMLAQFDSFETSRTLYKDLSPFATLRIALLPAPWQQQLWQQTQVFIYFALGVCLVLGLLSFLMLKRKLRAFSQIAHHYSTIVNNQFSGPLPVPHDKEGREITKMINHLIAQLEANFKRQATEAIKLKEQAYRDNVSSLGNRHYFINQLNSWLTDSHQGGLIILKSTLIDDIYREAGFEIGDKFVHSLAEELNANIIHSDVTLARLSYDEFAVLAPNISDEKLKVIAESMLTVHGELQQRHHIDYPDSVRLGMLVVHQASTASQLLAQLDNVLAKAALTPEQPLAIADDSQQPISLGKQQWKSLVLEAIDNNQIQYSYQPVASDTNNILHYEVFSEIRKNNQQYGASQFLGAIEDVGAGVQFDRHVIAHHINMLNANPKFGPIAINVTANSASDPAFIRWLTELMERNQRLSSRIFFEIPETSFVRAPDSCSLLCSAIRFYKFGMGVDNYGRYLKSLDYLREFRPDYVKIDFSYTHQLNDQVKINLLSSISRTAHSLNITTIATRVETETQLDRLSDLFVSGFQGYIIESQQVKASSGNPIQPALFT
ncbi:GGDEF domain-containing protein [Photobacterium japonica]|uniref:EAL domain-containing protein n=1 Tax=Photobacterium japonica TaxID=2910235 RepID=UPI003D0F5DCE